MTMCVPLQDGELVYCDWMPTRDSESGKLVRKSNKNKVPLRFCMD